MNDPIVDGPRAGTSLGLTGRYASQARQVWAGLKLWAADAAVDLDVVDDAGSPGRALAAYRDFQAGNLEILLGPYGSGTVRRVAPEVCGAGRLLWNHGGAANDLATPGLATVVAPASTYLHSLLAVARAAGIDEVVVVPGTGRFAGQVAEGGRRAAEGSGMRARRVEINHWDAVVDQLTLRAAGSLATAAVIFAATFQQDVTAVRQVRERGVEVGLLGCVAAGVDEFGRRLGPWAEGVLGPAQWWCHDGPVDVGPTGPRFVRRFQRRHGRAPDYLARPGRRGRLPGRRGHHPGLRTRPGATLAHQHPARPVRAGQVLAPDRLQPAGGAMVQRPEGAGSGSPAARVVVN